MQYGLFGMLLINVRQTKSLRLTSNKTFLEDLHKACQSPVLHLQKAFLRVIRVTSYAKEISFTFSLTVRDLEITSKKIISFFFPFILARYIPIYISK